MFDRLNELFRRADAAKPAVTKTSVPPAAPVLDPAIEAARAEQLAVASRELDNQPSGTTALRIAQGNFPAELRCRAVALVDDTGALRALALEDKVARVRLAAAERLTAADDLELLRRDSTDKAVQRHVRDALKAFREQEQAARDARARIDHLLTGITHHAARAFEPLYEAKLDSLASAWLPFAAQASAAEQERFAELAALARDTVLRHSAELASRSAAIAAKQELIAACTELEGAVSRLASEDLVSELSAVSALLSTQRIRWEEAASLTAVDTPLARRYTAAAAVLGRWLNAAAELPRVIHDASALLGSIAAQPAPDADTLDGWHETLAALRHRLDWPEGLHQPGIFAELEQAHRQLKSLRKAQQADREQQLAQLRKRRHALRRMIDEGQLRAATRTHLWLEKRIAELPARDAETERAALVGVTEALKTLHDWYEFASVPKKTALCERMEALTLNAPDIAARAEQVRELREQWNTLCAADPDADPELRTRFDRAARLAYAPCATWYAEQNRIQDDNLSKRLALCERLSAEIAALDATAINWKSLEQRERDARAEWKTYEPVRWPEARAGQDRFSTLIGDIRARLDGERRANAGRKRVLIEQARALLMQEPLESALGEAKKLQDDWKRIGYTDPREDRALWHEFRAAVDAVFARRDSARQAERAAREAAAAEAAARQASEAARRTERAQAVLAARQAEIDAALALALAEARWLEGATPDQATLDGILTGLTGKTPLVVALRTRSARIANGALPEANELAANTAKLAELTLDIEILFELPSAPEFAAARMARKIARLNVSLRGTALSNNKAGATENDARRALLDAWLASGPLPGSAHAALLARVLPALRSTHNGVAATTAG